MKLWATSCLHLNKATVEDKLKKLTSEWQIDPENHLMFLGDIVDNDFDSAPVAARLGEAMRGMKSILVRGNNDYSPWLYTGMLSLHLNTSYIACTGINIPGTPWELFHDPATKDDVASFALGLQARLSQLDFVRDKVKIFASHYPLFWQPLGITGKDNKLIIDKHVADLLGGLPQLEHIVFGHLHPDPIKLEGGNAADYIPKEVFINGRVIKVHLVSDHREKLLHYIGEFE